MDQPLLINVGSSVDISWNWVAWLGTDTIASFALTSSSGLTLTSGAQASGVVTAWASVTGAPGKKFTATCQITTASTPPRVESRDIQLEILRT